jgi:hypothetical protein
MNSAQRNFVLGQEVERERIILLLETECECDHDYRCTYHRMITLIRGTIK